MAFHVIFMPADEFRQIITGNVFFKLCLLLLLVCVCVLHVHVCACVRHSAMDVCRDQRMAFSRPFPPCTMSFRA